MLSEVSDYASARSMQMHDVQAYLFGTMSASMWTCTAGGHEEHTWVDSGGVGESGPCHLLKFADEMMTSTHDSG